MKIDPKAILIDSGIGDEIAVLVEQAINHHADTGRTASVTLKIVVALDKDSGTSKAKARLAVSLPVDDADTLTKKLPSTGLLTLDHPGQTKLET